MYFTVEDDLGEVSFTCADSLASRMTSEAILRGRTYPHLPFVGEVSVVLDIGANCGAASVFFARHNPRARVHAFEPGREALGFLGGNVADLPNVTIHPIGLADEDREALLHLDPEDIGQSSIVAPSGPGGSTEPVVLRHAGRWAADAGVDRVDLLKVDVEGCEIQVLEALGDLVAGAKVVYVEYDSRHSRRAIEQLLGPTHELYWAVLMVLDQGECAYLRRDLADHPEALPRIREIWGEALRAGG